MVYVSVFVSVSVSVSVFIFVLVFVFVFVSFTNENTIAIVLVIRNLLLLVLLFPPPLFIVVVLHHKTNIHDHPPRPFHRIYQSVSLMRRPGSFTLSLFTFCSDLVRVLLLPPPPSTVSIDPSLYYCVVRDFSSLFMWIRLCLVSYDIFFPLFTCPSRSCSSPFNRINLSVSLSCRTGSFTP